MHCCTYIVHDKVLCVTSSDVQLRGALVSMRQKPLLRHLNGCRWYIRLKLRNHCLKMLNINW